jgi:hypothetical protein
MSKIENSKKLLQKKIKEKYNKLKFLLKEKVLSSLNSIFKYIFHLLKDIQILNSNDNKS